MTAERAWNALLSRCVAAIAALQARRLFWPLLAIVAAVLSTPVFLAVAPNDMAPYALFAAKLDTGALLYRDVMDIKPPLLPYLFALSFRIFGTYELLPIKLLTIVVLAVTALALAAAATRLFARRVIPQVAAALFILSMMSGWGHDFLATNTEIYANLFLAIATWLFLRHGPAPRHGDLLLAGSAVGIGVLFRFQAAVFLPVAIGALGAFRPRGWALLTRIGALCLGFVAPVGAATWFFYSRHALDDLRFLLRLNIHYVQIGLLAAGALEVAGRILVVLASQADFLVPALIAAVAIVRNPSRSRGEVFLVLLFLGNLAAYGTGKRFFGHYFVQVVPAIALLAAPTVVRWASRTSPVRPSTRLRQLGAWYVRLWPLLVVARLGVFLVVNAASYAAARGDPTPELTSFLRTHVSPTDEVFAWDGCADVLLRAHRIFATRFASPQYVTGRMPGTRHVLPSATPESARDAVMEEVWPVLMGDLERRPPAAIVDAGENDGAFAVGRFPMLARFVAERYGPCHAIEGYCVYLRRH